MRPTHEHYVGERLSLKHQSCTIRYIGPVTNKAGSWLGVEWDDPTRGKHDGTFEGIKYFECRSKSLTAASFIKPTQSEDTARSFLTALREKYMPEFHKEEADIVYISGKQAEEIGFEKFAQRQSRLHGIRILVLDRMQIKHRFDSADVDREKATIRSLCVDITELDLTGNLFETFHEVLELCSLFPKLRVLSLNHNRFDISSALDYPPVTTLKSLNLARTLLTESELTTIFSGLPSLETLNLAENEISTPLQLRLPPCLTTLDVSDNHFTSISQLHNLDTHCPRTLILKRNKIQHVRLATDSFFALGVAELDITYNAVENWTFFDDITKTIFPNLTHLRVTGNPLYQHLISAESKPLAAEDGYMLTIARLPQLEYLNYAKITEKERLNSEIYYLNQIAAEISLAPEVKENQIISTHPRYAELCEEYGEPRIDRQQCGKGDVNPNSLAAALVTITFVLAPGVLRSVHQRIWIQELPKSLSIYALLGLVGKRLGVMPLNLRMILETNERDPVGRGRDNGSFEPEWWDSSDDEANGDEGAEWVKREVEIIAGTRTIGTYVEGQEAKIRIELRKGER